MKPSIFTSLSIVSLVSIAACAGPLSQGSTGDDDGEAPNQEVAAIESSVDAEKTAEELTDKEVQQFCQDVRSAAPTSDEELKRSLCFAKSVLQAAASKPSSDAALRSTCRKKFDECSAKPMTPPKKRECSQLTRKDMLGCKATVAEILACTEEQAASRRSVGAESCDALTLKKGSTNESSPGCKRVSSKGCTQFGG